MKTTIPDGAKVELNLDHLVENPENPRGVLQLVPHSSAASLTALQELAGSMNDVGLLQPIIVREVEGGHMVVCGHRRLAAARYLGWQKIPAIIRRLTEDQAREIALVENLQREDLEPLDEARGYQRLVEAGRTIAEIAAVVHRSRSTVAGRLALLDLPQLTIAALNEGQISMAVAAEIAKLPGQAQREAATNALAAAARSDWVDPGDDDADNVEVVTPCTLTEAQRIIRRRFMTDMAEAAFDPNDADLVPAAGSCTACPRRTGNQVDLFADLVAGPRGEDICTYPPCFESKKEAHAEILLTDAREAGHAVIPMTKAAKIFSPNGAIIDNKWVDADSRARNPVTGIMLKQTWRKALGKKAPQEAVAVNPHGEAVSLYSRKAAEAVLQEKYGKPEGAPANALERASGAKTSGRKRAEDRASCAARKVLSLMVPEDHDAQLELMLEVFRISAVDGYPEFTGGLCEEVWDYLNVRGEDEAEAYIANLDATQGDKGLANLYAQLNLFGIIRQAFLGRRNEDWCARIEKLIGRSFVSILAEVDQETEAAS